MKGRSGIIMAILKLMTKKAVQRTAMMNMSSPPSPRGCAYGARVNMLGRASIEERRNWAGTFSNRTVKMKRVLEGGTRQELSALLKTRRARISPGDVGLPSGDGRRIRGLRREEVAALAGVGL